MYVCVCIYIYIYVYCRLDSGRRAYRTWSGNTTDFKTVSKINKCSIAKYSYNNNNNNNSYNHIYNDKQLAWPSFCRTWSGKTMDFRTTSESEINRTWHGRRSAAAPRRSTSFAQAARANGQHRRQHRQQQHCSIAALPLPAAPQTAAPAEPSAAPTAAPPAAPPPTSLAAPPAPPATPPASLIAPWDSIV